MKGPQSSKTILVTGGAGYVGSILVPLLLERGHRVRVLDCFYFGEETLSGVRNHPNLTLVRDDILNHENHPDLFKGVDVVVHLAAITNDPACDLDPNLTVKVNYFATVALARRAKTEGVRHFIFASSCSVYGANGDKWLNEDSELQPVTLYALSKLQSEHSLRPLVGPTFGVTIFRFATLFGLSPRMRFDLAINVMTKRAVEGHNMVVNGTGEQYRPFLHVRDTADAITQVLEEGPEKSSGDVFNLGSEPMNYSIANLAKEIQAFFPNTKVENTAKGEDIRSYRVSFEKVKNKLGIVPKRRLKDGVEEITQALKNKTIKEPDHEKYYTLLVLKKALPKADAFYSPAATPTWSDFLPSRSKASAGIASQANNVLPLRRQKIIAMILAYNCAKMLPRAFERIPKELVDDIIVMDDGSKDNTSEVARSLGLKVFRNDPNRGYGGNVKAGLRKAIELGADYVVEIHGDGAQFNPISIGYALSHMQQNADLILGSRFQQPRQALKNGMPLIRFVANRFLSFFDRLILRLPLTEFHTGFRIYSRKLVESVPYDKNTNDYLFSFQIIAQAAYYRKKVAEVPVEADYISEHTSHHLLGAARYAILTYVQLFHFILARMKLRYTSVFQPLGEGSSGGKPRSELKQRKL